MAMGLTTTHGLEATDRSGLRHAAFLLDRGIGHLIPTLDPRTVIVATKAVLAAAATRRPLAPCPQVFRSVPTAECLRRGQPARQRT